MRSFENSVYTCFTRFVRPVKCCRPRISCSKSFCMSAEFAIMAGLQTSAKGSTWNAMWLSNTSGFGRRTCPTAFSRYPSSNLPGTVPMLSSYLAILSGNYRLEAPISSQHLTFAGSLCIHGPPVFPHRLWLDAKWEHNGIYEVESRGKPFTVGKPTRRLHEFHS